MVLRFTVQEPVNVLEETHLSAHHKVRVRKKLDR